ncbi:MAG: hypothetical protein K2X91_01945, partial [Thermoleophilia bacterium]|nr:hypothetical protein [Thermoleophilia bacterium]
GALATWLGLASRPADLIRLRLDGREAPGQVVAARRTEVTQGNDRICEVEFTFATTDGLARRGRCHAPASALGVQGQRAPALPAAQTVQYVASDPSIARIRGGWFGTMGPFFAGLLSVPALIALLVVRGGWVWARQRARLLESGTVAEATLLTYRSGTGKDGTDLERPIASLFDGEGNGPRLPLAELPLEYRRVGRGCIHFWTIWTLLIVVFGTLGLLVAIGSQLLPNAPPIEINGRPASRMTGLLTMLGALAVWVTVGGLMLRFGRRATRSAWFGPGARGGDDAAQAPTPGIPETLALPVTFEYRPPGSSTPIRGTETLRLARLPLVAPPASSTLPVLYDPERPDVSLLLWELPRGLEFSDQGIWDTPMGAQSSLRLAIAATALAGGPLLGWLLWRLS